MIRTEIHVLQPHELWIPPHEIASTVQKVGPQILKALKEEFPERVKPDSFPVCGSASLLLGYYLSETFDLPVQQDIPVLPKQPWLEFPSRDHHFPEENAVIDQGAILLHTGASFDLHIDSTFTNRSSCDDPFRVEMRSSYRPRLERELQREYNLYPYSPDVSPRQDWRVFFTSSTPDEHEDLLWGKHHPDVVFSDEGFVGPSGIYRQTPILWGSRLVRCMRKIQGDDWHPQFTSSPSTW